MTRCLMIILMLVCTPSLRADDAVVIGSKNFTEGVVIGDLAMLVLHASDIDATHRRSLGGTRVLFEALRSGQIDAYGDYTGTLSQELVPGTPPEVPALRAALRPLGLGITGSLGFNDTYAIAVRRDLAEARGIRTISDLRGHPDLIIGVGNEFLGRSDGWPGLKAAYQLPQTDVRGLEHDLAVAALRDGAIDATDVYTTEAKIDPATMVLLEDDLAFFPPYQSVIVHRLDLADRMPGAIEAFASLEGRFDETTMQGMNAAVEIGGRAEVEVASDALARVMGVEVEAAIIGPVSRILRRTIEHLRLVMIAMALGIAIGVPLGVAAFRHPRTGRWILGLVGVLQTIPSLALLVFMIPLLGIGAAPAIAALFLYSLLPIVRNTELGLRSISPSLRESAAVLGFAPWGRFRRIELPLALPAMLAGIRTSTVMIIGFAVLGALIGAGGYGQPILNGVRLLDERLIMEGAIPAAVMAILAQWMLGVVERHAVSRGLRIHARS